MAFDFPATPPFGEMDDVTFEELCRSLWQLEGVNCHRHGTSGSGQQGADLICFTEAGSISIGQCKSGNGFSIGEWNEELDEFEKKHADFWANLDVKIYRLYIAITWNKAMQMKANRSWKSRLARIGMHLEIYDASHLRIKIMPHPYLVGHFLNKSPDEKDWVRILCGDHRAARKSTMDAQNGRAVNEKKLYSNGRLICDNLLTLSETLGNPSERLRAYLPTPCRLNQKESFEFHPELVTSLFNKAVERQPIAVMGPAGSGKTFVIARLYDFLLNRYVTNAERFELPIYLTFAECYPEMNEAIPSLARVTADSKIAADLRRRICRAISQRYYVEDDEALALMLMRKQFILLLDGLEELSAVHTNEAVLRNGKPELYFTPMEAGLAALHGIASGGLRIIYSCRNEEWAKVRMFGIHQEEFDLLPIENFQNVFAALTGTCLPEDLQTNDNILRFPLFLAIAIKVHRQLEGWDRRLDSMMRKAGPDEFIVDYIELLLGDDRQGHADIALPSLALTSESRQKTEKFCHRLAEAMQETFPRTRDSTKVVDAGFTLDQISPHIWCRKWSRALTYRLLFGLMYGVFLGGLTGLVNLAALVYESFGLRGLADHGLVSLRNGVIACAMVWFSIAFARGPISAGIGVGTAFAFARALVLLQGRMVG